MTKRWRSWLDPLIDPYLVTVLIILIANHWEHLSVGDFILLVFMIPAIGLRIFNRR